MRVTIVSDDNKVLVGGVARTVDLTGLDPTIWAVQWYSSIGEIEYRYDFATNSQRPNARFADFSPYQVFVDRWTAAAPVSTAAAVVSSGS